MRGNVPIVKCIHNATNIECNLNFTHIINVFSSQIMRHLLTFDDRIYALATLIKYWMKVHNLIGSNGIDGYAVNMLVVFYLQQLKSPLLPPIELFQRFIPPVFIGNANVAFNYELRYFLPNNQRISDLLVGFFNFYAKFDFENLLISPLYGRTYQRKDLAQIYPNDVSLMNQPANSKQCANLICILDPFEVYQTMPGGITKEFFQTFRLAIANAAKIGNEKLANCGESKHLLLALFDARLMFSQLFMPNVVNMKRF